MSLCLLSHRSESVLFGLHLIKHSYYIANRQNKSESKLFYFSDPDHKTVTPSTNGCVNCASHPTTP